MMSLRCVLAVVAFFALPGVSIAEPDTVASKLASCGKCHVGKLALTGRTAEDLLEGLHKIRAGQRPHPPGLQVFGPEELSEVAEILSGAASTEVQP